MFDESDKIIEINEVYNTFGGSTLKRSIKELAIAYKNPLQNFRLDKYFGLFEGYAETLRGNCSDFRQIDQY
jgi:hypothetical protein